MSEFNKVDYPVDVDISDEIKSVRDKLSGRLPSIKKAEDGTINSLSQFDKFVEDHGEYFTGHATIVDKDTGAEVLTGIYLEESHVVTLNGEGECNPVCLFPWYCENESCVK